MENIANILTGKRSYPVFHRIPGTIFLVIYLCVCPSISTAVSIWPTEIKFDYEPGYSNDALDIRLDADQDVQVPEWILYGRHYKCAYIKGQTNLKIHVRFDSDTDNTNFLIKATVYTGVGIGSVCEAFIADCEIDENDWITLFIAGSVPSSVGIRTFVWKWEATALPMSSPYCPVTCNPVYTEHTYYTLLAEPQEPMPEPWTSVLNYACEWASGQTTNSGVLNSLTSYLYSNSGLEYEGGQSHYRPDIWPNPNKFIFDLTDFIYDWYEADCQDCSMFLSILSSSLGASLTQTSRIQGNFSTKNILPVGWTNWNDFDWVFHHIGWLNNVYDPTCKLNPYSSYIPINVNINIPYKSDLYYYGSWLPQEPFRLGELDPFFQVSTEIQ